MNDNFYDNRISKPVVKVPYITYTLIGIGFAVAILDFLLFYLTNYPWRSNYYLLFALGAKHNPSIMQGQYWRLITPIFLHGGIIHLAVNSYSLYAVGPEVEKIFGRVKFIIIYLFAGLMGNIASFLFVDEISIGASGAIFGLLGALIYLGIKYRDVVMKAYFYNILAMVAINLVYGFMNKHIDNAAHIGGLVGGFLVAIVLGVGVGRKFQRD